MIAIAGIRTGGLALAAAMSVLLFASPAMAEDKEIEELRARLEKLEKRADGGELKSVDAKAGKSPQDPKNPASPMPYEVGSDLNFKAVWRDGLELSTPQKDFIFRVRGRIQQVWGFGHDDPDLEATLGRVIDGANFRRLRLGASGTVYEIMEFVTEVDFAGGIAQPVDVYLDLTKLPVIGNFRAGHFREPFSLDQLTSDNYIPFLERSLLDEAFVPARSLGVMLHNREFDERVSWAVGIFRPETDPTGADFGEGDYSYTGRLTVLPWYVNDGRCLLHLGVAASHRMLDNDDTTLLRFRTRPELRAIRLQLPGGPLRDPYFADTGDLLADSVDLFGAEAALVLGPFSLQGEYVCALVKNASTAVDDIRRGNVTFQGCYAMASYFLTGEHREYRRSWAAFDRIRPFENFFWVETGEEPVWRRCCFGTGAWELLVRYSYLDLDNSGIDGGNLQNITVGLNWYINANARCMWNYILSHRDGPGTGGDGWAQLLGIRVQWDF